MPHKFSNTLNQALCDRMRGGSGVKLSKKKSKNSVESFHTSDALDWLTKST
jgi:hypothetical protein